MLREILSSRQPRCLSTPCETNHLRHHRLNDSLQRDLHFRDSHYVVIDDIDPTNSISALDILTDVNPQLVYNNIITYANNNTNSSLNNDILTLNSLVNTSIVYDSKPPVFNTVDTANTAVANTDKNTPRSNVIECFHYPEGWQLDAMSSDTSRYLETVASRLRKEQRGYIYTFNSESQTRFDELLQLVDALKTALNDAAIRITVSGGMGGSEGVGTVGVVGEGRRCAVSEDGRNDDIRLLYDSILEMNNYLRWMCNTACDAYASAAENRFFYEHP